MVWQKIRRMMSEIQDTDEENITMATPLCTGALNIDAAKLIIRAERAFKIEIPDEEAAGFLSLGDLVNYIGTLLLDGQDDYRQPSERERQAWYYE